jgi:hypothetical protein
MHFPFQPRQHEQFLCLPKSTGSFAGHLRRSAEHEKLVDENVLVHPAAVVLAGNGDPSGMMLHRASNVASASVYGILDSLAPPFFWPVLVISQSRREELAADSYLRVRHEPFTPVTNVDRNLLDAAISVPLAEQCCPAKLGNC